MRLTGKPKNAADILKLTAQGIKTIPIVENGKLASIITRTDLIKHYGQEMG